MDEGFAAEQASEYTGTYFSSLAGSTDRAYSRGGFTAKQAHTSLQVSNRGLTV